MEAKNDLLCNTEVKEDVNESLNNSEMQTTEVKQQVFFILRPEKIESILFWVLTHFLIYSSSNGWFWWIY